MILRPFPREACLRILIQALDIFLCYVEIFEISFFTLFYVLWHKIKTRTLIQILRHASLERNVVKGSLKLITVILNS